MTILPAQTGHRTFLAGKLISNFGQSTIDCVVRQLSDDGATVEVENPLGIPQHCHLLIVEEGNPSPLQARLAIGQTNRCRL